MIALPFGKKVTGIYRPPYSKSILIRSIIIASLIDRKVTIKNFTPCEDVQYAIEIAGKTRKISFFENEIHFEGKRSNFKEKEIFFCGGSATIARFLLAIFSFMEGERIIDGNENLRKRDLSSSIENARHNGAKVIELKEKGKLPLKVFGSIKNKIIELSDDSSSQFSSGVLIGSSIFKKGSKIILIKSVSNPYIEMTYKVLRKFNFGLKKRKNVFFIEESHPKDATIEIEGDFSNASFFIAGNILTKGNLNILGLKKNSIQGDSKIVEILKENGLFTKFRKGFLKISGSIKRGITVNLKDFPDLLPPLSIIALSSEGKSTFYGVKRLKDKESSRCDAIKDILNSIGAKVKIGDDFLEITPSSKYKGAVFDPRGDHRIAMMCGFLGLIAKGSILKDEMCVSKSYPNFWEDFKAVLCD